jgi:daunorubicin/doxorubicin transport system ATP-binding protein
MSKAAMAVQTRGLVKNFGRTRAVDAIDLAVPRGQVFGLLGPNGAGKTTTVRMLATLLAPDTGTACVFGHDVVREADAVRRRISVTGQFASIDKDLTGIENLRLQARLLGLPRRAADRRARELLEGFDLADSADRQVKRYSGGMQRRLDLAAGVVVMPELLFLDEPTTGLDPRSRNQVWEIVRTLAEQGVTVVLTTQYLDEADQLSDRIAVVDHGRLVADDTPSRLKASVGSGVLRIELADPARRADANRVLSEALRTPVQAGPDPAALTVRVPVASQYDGGAQVTDALGRLAHAGIGVAAFALDQPSLDEVFLALTGHPTAEEAA